MQVAAALPCSLARTGKHKRLCHCPAHRLKLVQAHKVYSQCIPEACRCVQSRNFPVAFPMPVSMPPPSTLSSYLAKAMDANGGRLDHLALMAKGAGIGTIRKTVLDQPPRPPPKGNA